MDQRFMQYLPVAVIGSAFLLVVAVVLFFWFFASRGAPLAVLEPAGTPSVGELKQATSVLGDRLKMIGAQSSVISEWGNRFTVSATLPPDSDKRVVRRALTDPGFLEILPAKEAPEATDTDESVSRALQGAECVSSPLFLECQGYLDGKRRTWRLDRGTNGIEDFCVADAQPQKNAKGDWELRLTLSAEGARQLGEFTREHLGQTMGVVLDNRVLSAIPITAIEDGVLVIAMDHRDPSDDQQSNARVLAAVLRVRPMPMAFKDVTDSIPPR